MKFKNQKYNFESPALGDVTNSPYISSPSRMNSPLNMRLNDNLASASKSHRRKRRDLLKTPKYNLSIFSPGDKKKSKKKREFLEGEIFSLSQRISTMQKEALNSHTEKLEIELENEVLKAKVISLESTIVNLQKELDKSITRNWKAFIETEDEPQKYPKSSNRSKHHNNFKYF